MESSRQSITLPVLGMSCAACQHHVEAALRATAGVHEARVDLLAHRVTVVCDAAMAAETLIESIRNAGYDSVLPRANQLFSATEATSLRKSAITMLAGALVMFLSMPMSGEMNVSDFARMQALRWLCLFVTASVTYWAGRSVYLSAARGLRHGTTNMNTLVSLGTGAAFLYSAFATLIPAPGRDVYFDAVLLILGFLLLGKALEARAKQRALAALDSLSRMSPIKARRLRYGKQEVVPLAEIALQDEILVLPGERFPVDASILEGRTTVDESLLTGESKPMDRAAGDRVLAGSLNYDGAVHCRAESLGESTVLAQITRMVQQAQSSRAPMERLADRASSIFVPIVLTLALLTFFAWIYFSHSFQLALANTVAVLVIACPCAMGLAVPAALTVAVGRGAQLGVLFKGGDALERLAHLDVIVLDKTGTLSVGRPVLEAIHPLDSRDSSELLRIAAAAEERSNHPLAHAIVEAAREQQLVFPSVEDVRIHPGRGLFARVDGRDCLLGNAALFQEFFLPVPHAQTPISPGVTRLLLSIDGKPAACFDARDSLRSDATEAVAALRSLNLRVLMLTGDSLDAARVIAQQAGIDECEASLDPAAKLARIRDLQQQGLRVAMAGDGINDAAALAHADAGLAMGSGADLAQEAGDVLLLRATPASIPAAMELARATLAVMRQNLAWAAGYNLLGIPLAAGALYPAFHILLSPWLASAAMALSSISVLANSLRLRRWNPRHAPSR